MNKKYASIGLIVVFAIVVMACFSVGQVFGINIMKRINVTIGGINMNNGSIVGLATDPSDVTSAVTLDFVLNSINAFGLADMAYINAALGRCQDYFNSVAVGADLSGVEAMLNAHWPRINAAKNLVDSFTWSGSWGDKVMRDGSGSSNCIAVWGHTGAHSAGSSCKVNVTDSSMSVAYELWLWGPDMHVNGNLYGPNKYFLLDHPSKDDMRLVHACLEGPEIAVFYRGEGQLVNGEAIIELPEYFEALTRKEGRTVFLTPRFDLTNEPVSRLAASAVKNGKFEVIATDNNNPEQKFYWKVKAERADLPPLEVEEEAEKETYE